MDVGQIFLALGSARQRRQSVTISELCKGIAGHNWGYFYKNLVGALMDMPVIVASTNRHYPRFPSSDDNVMKIID